MKGIVVVAAGAARSAEEAFDVSNKRRAVDASGISLIEQTKASGIYRAKPNSRKPDARPLCLAGFSPVPDAMKSSPTVK